MKRFILIGIMSAGFLAGAAWKTSAKGLGETAHPVYKHEFTHE